MAELFGLGKTEEMEGLRLPLLRWTARMGLGRTWPPNFRVSASSLGSSISRPSPIPKTTHSCFLSYSTLLVDLVLTIATIALEGIYQHDSGVKT
jgi:hypothetical protein